MIKNILHPGNGIDFPKKGEYVKYSLVIKTKNGDVLFDSENISGKGLEVRFDTDESFLFKELEELIGEMSLFEKCSLEVAFEDVKNYEGNFSESLLELLKDSGKSIFEVEIQDISKFSHF